MSKYIFDRGGNNQIPDNHPAKAFIEERLNALPNELQQLFFTMFTDTGNIHKRARYRTLEHCLNSLILLLGKCSYCDTWHTSEKNCPKCNEITASVSFIFKSNGQPISYKGALFDNHNHQRLSLLYDDNNETIKYTGETECFLEKFNNRVALKRSGKIKYSPPFKIIFENFSIEFLL